MKHVPLSRIFMRWLLAAVLAVSMVACASRPELVDHAFGFDLTMDHQENVEVLDYRYGNSKLPVFAPPDLVAKGHDFGSANVIGPMVRGDFLYVKWRLKDTGQIYEETVGLKKRLPKDITDCRITFLIRGSQLFVYLVTPKPLPDRESPNGPHMYRGRKVITLYPDTTQN